MNADLLAGSPWIPQSLNRYACTSNNPINLVDPLGLTVIAFQHKYCVSSGGGPEHCTTETIFVNIDDGRRRWRESGRLLSVYPVGGGGAGSRGPSPTQPSKKGSQACKDAQQKVKDLQNSKSFRSKLTLVRDIFFGLGGSAAVGCGAGAVTGGRDRCHRRHIRRTRRRHGTGWRRRRCGWMSRWRRPQCTRPCRWS